MTLRVGILVAVVSAFFLGHTSSAVSTKRAEAFLCCETYSLRDYMNQGKYDCITVMKLMKNLGIKGVALNDIWIQSYEKPYLDKIKKAAKDNGIIIAALICGGNLVSEDPIERRNQIAQNAMKIRAAAYLGASLVRLNVGTTGNAYRDSTVGVARAASAFNELLPEAKRYNVKITMENHGGVTAEADNIIKIIERTDPKYVGACLDFKNWPKLLLYEENAKLAPYAMHVHAKTHSFTADGEEAEVEYSRLLNLLKNAGYKGAISIEFEGQGDQIGGILKTRQLILKHWPIRSSPVRLLHSANPLGHTKLEKLVYWVT